MATTTRTSDHPAPTVDDLRREFDALRHVGRAIVEADDMSTVFDRIASEAARVVGARAASVLLERFDHLEVAGAYELGDRYRETLENPTHAALVHRGPATLALELKQHFVVEDTEADPRYAPWRSVAREEGFRALVVVPLVAAEGAVLGTLDAYRAEPGPWLDRHVQMLVMFADHVANAVRTAHLIDRQRDQVLALERLVETLREQRHEHVNRLHAIGGLLALGEDAAARRMISSLGSEEIDYRSSTSERVRNDALCGLLISQMAIARQRGIDVELSRTSSVERLPNGVSDADAITVIGNLLDNAIDAVAELPAERRRIVVDFAQRGSTATWSVSDHGPGVSPAVADRVLQPHVSTKDAHEGIGLALVSRVLQRLGGRLTFKTNTSGSTFVATMPNP